MSIKSALQNASQKVTAAYTAISEKKGKVFNVRNLNVLSNTINTIPINNNPSNDNKYLIKVIDYDGTVLKFEYLNEGDTFTLPDTPLREKLVFQQWSSPVTITNNTITVSNFDIIIGAIYTTISGLTEFDISNASTIMLDIEGIKNWGDGTSDSLTTHTYNIPGDYTITCDVVNIPERTIFGDYKHFVKNIRFGSNLTTIGYTSFLESFSIETITIPNNVTTINGSAFSGCYSLKNINIPNSITTLSNQVFNNCYSLKNIIIPTGMLTINRKIAFNCHSLEKIIIPNTVTTIGQDIFWNCYSLKNAIIPSSVTAIDNSVFKNCVSLENITILGNITTIGTAIFQDCFSLKSVTIANGITNINNDLFANCYSLKRIAIPRTVTRIGTYAFSNCTSILEYDFSNHSSVPTLAGTSTFTGINSLCKIKVPTALVTSWKAASNWKTFANYIVGV